MREEKRQGRACQRPPLELYSAAGNNTMNPPNVMRNSKELNASKLIFVVDDEPLLGELAETILRAEGYQTRFFTDPTLAIQALDESAPPPQVLLTDFQMESMNGMKLIEQCKRRIPGLRTILCSGKVDEGILRKYYVKPDLFLRKPFEPEVLLEMIRVLLAAAS